MGAVSSGRKSTVQIAGDRIPQARLSQQERLSAVADCLNEKGPDGAAIRQLVGPLVGAGWNPEKVAGIDRWSLAQIGTHPPEEWPMAVRAIMLVGACRADRNLCRRLRRKGRVERLAVEAVTSRRRQDLRKCPRGECGRYFLRSDARQMFCSESCKDKVGKERWRIRHEVARQGRAVEELLVLIERRRRGREVWISVAREEHQRIGDSRPSRRIRTALGKKLAQRLANREYVAIEEWLKEAASAQELFERERLRYGHAIENLRALGTDAGSRTLEELERIRSYMRQIEKIAALPGGRA
jgi:hypothetical protein